MLRQPTDSKAHSFAFKRVIRRKLFCKCLYLVAYDVTLHWKYRKSFTFAEFKEKCTYLKDKQLNGSLWDDFKVFKEAGTKFEFRVGDGNMNSLVAALRLLSYFLCRDLRENFKPIIRIMLHWEPSTRWNFPLRLRQINALFCVRAKYPPPGPESIITNY